MGRTVLGAQMSAQGQSTAGATSRVLAGAIGTTAQTQSVLAATARTVFFTDQDGIVQSTAAEFARGRTAAYASSQIQKSTVATSLNISCNLQSQQVETAEAQFMRNITSFAASVQHQSMAGIAGPIISLSNFSKQVQTSQLTSLLLSNQPSVYIAYVEINDVAADVALNQTSVMVPAE